MRSIRKEVKVKQDSIGKGMRRGKVLLERKLKNVRKLGMGRNFRGGSCGQTVPLSWVGGSHWLRKS